MKFRFFALVVAFALTTIAAHAQVGLYLNPIATRVSNSQARYRSLRLPGRKLHLQNVLRRRYGWLLQLLSAGQDRGWRGYSRLHRARQQRVAQQLPGRNPCCYQAIQQSAQALSPGLGRCWNHTASSPAPCASTGHSLRILEAPITRSIATWISVSSKSDSARL